MVGIQYLNLVLSTRDYSLISSVPDLDELLTIPIEHKALNFIKSHYQQYNCVPDVATLLRKVPEFEVYNVQDDPLAILNDMREQRLAIELRPVLEKSAKLYSEGTSFEALDYLNGEVERLNTLGVKVVDYYDYTQDESRLEEYEYKQNLEDMVGITTGFKTLDEVTLGWWNGHFNAVAGRPNEGKTWVGMKFATEAWKAGNRTAYFALESSKEEVAYRFDTLIANFANMALYAGSLTEEEYKRYLAHFNMLKKKHPLYIVNNSDNMGRPWKASEIARFIEENEIKFVVIDGGLHMIDESESKDIWQKYASISLESKEYAEKTDIPWLTVLQANRSASKKRDKEEAPELDEIYMADAWGQWADRLITIKQVPPLMKLVLKKNRFGPKEVTVMSKWEVNTGVIEEVNMEGVDLF